MLTVWCYRPLCNHTSAGKVAWTWVGNSTPHILHHHSELTATFRLMFFTHAHIHKNLHHMMWLNLEVISHRLCFHTFSAQVCLNSALLSRFILFDHSCVFVVCVSEAMLHCLYGLQCLRLELNGKRGKKREKKQTVSLHQSWQLLLFHITSSPLVPIFIATHLSPCHHICIHPPANYTAPFPQTTLISNDVFSACVGIRNINGG